MCGIMQRGAPALYQVPHIGGSTTTNRWGRVCRTLNISINNDVYRFRACVERLRAKTSPYFLLTHSQVLPRSCVHKNQGSSAAVMHMVHDFFLAQSSIFFLRGDRRPVELIRIMFFLAQIRTHRE